MKNKILLILCVAFINTNVLANHLMGGEITWECLTSASVPTPAPADIGKYIFSLRLYKDCRSATTIATSLQVFVHNHPSVSDFNVNFKSQKDISPTCITTSPAPLACGGGQAGAVRVSLFQSDPIGLPGIPPAQGWAFTFTATPRQPSLTNVDIVTGPPSATGLTLRAIMFPYNNLNEGPCFDSSPKFINEPAVVSCAGLSPFKYSDAAYDSELDSLRYDWAEALDQLASGAFSSTNPSPLTYNVGYSYSSPFPGTLQDANNSAAVMDNLSGEVTFTSVTPGEFVRVVQVSAYKGGILVAKVFRELQFIIRTDCDLTNTPAVIAPPFNSASDFDTIVNAGDSVTFVLRGIDSDVFIADQALTITANGIQFGTGYTSTTAGCLNPPCATLNPPPGNSAITNHQSPVQTTFGWRTDCKHIDFSKSPGSLSNRCTYTFSFKVADRICDVPGYKNQDISITVIGKPIITPPLIKCVSVLPDGKVDLHWTPAVDIQNSFMEQSVYASNGGPFAKIYTTTNINIGTYLDVAANANNTQWSYFIETKSGCSGTPVHSDTVRTILLDVNSTSGGGIAHLTWNPLAIPSIPSSAGIYKVEMKYPVSSPTWVQIGTSTSLSYDDIVSICNDTVIYRVSIDDNSLGCTSYSNVSGAKLGDNTPPNIPTIDVASIENTSFVAANITWDNSVNADIDHYEIYKKDPDPSFIYTSIGISVSNNFTDNSASPLINSEPVHYRVAAIDSCNNKSPYSIDHQTIYLKNVLDHCKAEFQLTWTKYKNFPGGLDGYHIYAVLNPPGIYNLVGTTTDTTFTMSSLSEGANYCMYVEAYGGTKIARSNKVCGLADVPTKPQFLYLKSATVKDDTTAIVKAAVDINADVKHYDLYRSSNNGSDFELINTVGNTFSPVINFEDKTIKSLLQSYIYRISAVDSCDLIAMTSNIGKTIHLVGVADDDMVNNNLYWNGYVDWITGVDKYNIYRNNKDYPGDVLVGSVSSSLYTYSDNIVDFPAGAGEFCYYIEAIENVGSVFNQDTSYSNKFCLIQHPGVFIPSGFNPSGVNKEFRPVLSYIASGNYDFKIFNRWGQVVFSTNNIEEGWDGTYRNRDAEGGVYVYSLRFNSTQGVTIEKKGTITLIR